MAEAPDAPRIDAVIFDLDGTLADTLLDISDAMNRALAARGLPGHAPSHYRALIGKGARELALQVVPDKASALADEVLEAFRREYYAHPLGGRTAPYPGVHELLAELSAQGVPMAVLSNKPQQPTTSIVEALFPGVPFVAVYGERPPLPRKPDPQTALALAQELGVPPEHCAFVGDTGVDVATALAARMLPIAVLWGFRDEPELRGAGASRVIARPHELLAAIGRRRR